MSISGALSATVGATLFSVGVVVDGYFAASEDNLYITTENNSRLYLDGFVDTRTFGAAIAPPTSVAVSASGVVSPALPATNNLHTLQTEIFVLNLLGVNYYGPNTNVVYIKSHLADNDTRIISVASIFENGQYNTYIIQHYVGTNQFISAYHLTAASGSAVIRSYVLGYDVYIVNSFGAFVYDFYGNLIISPTYSLETRWVGAANNRLIGFLYNSLHILDSFSSIITVDFSTLGDYLNYPHILYNYADYPRIAFIQAVAEVSPNLFVFTWIRSNVNEYHNTTNPSGQVVYATVVHKNGAIISNVELLSNTALQAIIASHPIKLNELYGNRHRVAYGVDVAKTENGEFVARVAVGEFFGHGFTPNPITILIRFSINHAGVSIPIDVKSYAQDIYDEHSATISIEYKKGAVYLIRAAAKDQYVFGPCYLDAYDATTLTKLQTIALKDVPLSLCATQYGLIVAMRGLSDYGGGATEDASMAVYPFSDDLADVSGVDADFFVYSRYDYFKVERSTVYTPSFQIVYDQTHTPEAVVKLTYNYDVKIFKVVDEDEYTVNVYRNGEFLYSLGPYSSPPTVYSDTNTIVVVYDWDSSISAFSKVNGQPTDVANYTWLRDGLPSQTNALIKWPKLVSYNNDIYTVATKYANQATYAFKVENNDAVSSDKLANTIQVLHYAIIDDNLYLAISRPPFVTVIEYAMPSFIMTRYCNLPMRPPNELYDLLNVTINPNKEVFISYTVERRLKEDASGYYNTTGYIVDVFTHPFESQIPFSVVRTQEDVASYCSMLSIISDAPLDANGFFIVEEAEFDTEDSYKVERRIVVFAPQQDSFADITALGDVAPLPAIYGNATVATVYDLALSAWINISPTPVTRSHIVRALPRPRMVYADPRQRIVRKVH